MERGRGQSFLIAASPVPDLSSCSDLCEAAQPSSLPRANVSNGTAMLAGTLRSNSSLLSPATFLPSFSPSLQHPSVLLSYTTKPVHLSVCTAAGSMLGRSGGAMAVLARHQPVTPGHMGCLTYGSGLPPPKPSLGSALKQQQNKPAFQHRPNYTQAADPRGPEEQHTEGQSALHVLQVEPYDRD